MVTVAGPACRGCGCQEVRRVVDLGPQPPSDEFPAVGDLTPDGRRPLELWWCPQCTLVQLGPVEAVLEEPVRAVESDTSRRHARQAVEALLAERPQLSGRTVREFASHHGGSWLEALAGHGCRPAPDGEPAALVVDTHALAHEHDLAASLARRAAALRPDGLLVIEHHHLLPLITEGQFDTVRHGHWSYLSLTAVTRLAPRHGLAVVHAVTEPVFGGSLRVTLASAAGGHPVDPSVEQILAAERAAGLADGSCFDAFEARAFASARALRAYLTAQQAAGRSVLGYGAPSKAAVLLGLAGIGTDLLDFTVDAAPLKHGRVIPGVRVPIRAVADLVAARPDVVLVLTWDIADEIVTQLESAGGWGAEYVLPLPTPCPMPVGTRARGAT